MEDKKVLIVPHHKLISREMRPEELGGILHDVEGMHRLCNTKIGNYKGADAVSHCQVNNTEPLRFLVTKTGNLIINPVIVRREQPTLHKEGCVSFPNHKPKMVKRHRFVTVIYLGIDVESKSIQQYEEQAKGDRAFMFQHEIDHMNGKSIYDN